MLAMKPAFKAFGDGLTVARQYLDSASTAMRDADVNGANDALFNAIMYLGSVGHIGSAFAEGAPYRAFDEAVRQGVDGLELLLRNQAGIEGTPALTRPVSELIADGHQAVTRGLAIPESAFRDVASSSEEIFSDAAFVLSSSPRAVSLHKAVFVA